MTVDKKLIISRYMEVKHISRIFGYNFPDYELLIGDWEFDVPFYQFFMTLYDKTWPKVVSLYADAAMSEETWKLLIAFETHDDYLVSIRKELRRMDRAFKDFANENRGALLSVQKRATSQIREKEQS